MRFYSIFAIISVLERFPKCFEVIFPNVYSIAAADELPRNHHRHHRAKRLIGGEGFAEGKWPWLVSLQGRVPGRMLFNKIPISYQRFYCGASLLNDRWILTAAHCFTETNLG